MLRIHQNDIQEQLRSKGIDPDHIKALHLKLQSGELDQNSFVIPIEQLALPTNDLAVSYDPTAKGVGVEALRSDQLLLFWLNGGAATRYGATQFANLPKGVTPVVDGVSYLELKIKNLLDVTRKYQLDDHPQVILMNSFMTDQPTREHLAALFQRYPDLNPERFHYVVQQASIPRFTKATDMKNIDVFVDSQGQLSWAPCGHGDFVYLLKDYLKQTHIPAVRYLFFSNIDNLAATLDPVLLGQHIQSQQGRTVEVVEKLETDQGGLPCLVNGQLIIVEQMKLPSQFPRTDLPWMNTNNFWFTLTDLLSYQQDLPWVLAEKTITEGEVIQLERFACDVNLPSQYIVVDRAQRFWPVKYYNDLLEYQKQPAFKQLLRERFQVEG